MLGVGPENVIARRAVHRNFTPPTTQSSHAPMSSVLKAVSPVRRYSTHSKWLAGAAPHRSQIIRAGRSEGRSTLTEMTLIVSTLLLESPRARYKRSVMAFILCPGVAEVVLKHTLRSEQVINVVHFSSHSGGAPWTGAQLLTLANEVKTNWGNALGIKGVTSTELTLLDVVATSL
jgi:hypothetical protein